jgi:hypothetical protein
MSKCSIVFAMLFVAASLAAQETTSLTAEEAKVLLWYEKNYWIQKERADTLAKAIADSKVSETLTAVTEAFEAETKRVTATVTKVIITVVVVEVILEIARWVVTAARSN